MFYRTAGQLAKKKASISSSPSPTARDASLRVTPGLRRLKTRMKPSKGGSRPTHRTRKYSPRARAKAKPLK